MTQEISEIIKIISEVSPFLFETARNQVNVHIFTFTLAALVSLVSSGLSGYMFWYWRKKTWESEKIVALSILMISAIFFVAFTCSVIGRVLNPNYYAVEVIMSLIRTGAA